MNDHPADPQPPRQPIEAAPASASAARHRAHQSPARSHRLSVRLSDAERQLVAEAAYAAGLTSAGFAAKAALIVAAGHGGAPTATLADALRELQRELFAARRAVNMFASNVNQAAAAFNTTGELPVWVADAVALCRTAVARLDEVATRLDRRLR